MMSLFVVFAIVITGPLILPNLIVICKIKQSLCDRKRTLHFTHQGALVIVVTTVVGQDNVKKKESPLRVNFDNYINKHGETLIEFLKDTHFELKDLPTK